MAKVLIIEDEKTLAKMYKDVFEQNDHQVRVVHGVDDALEAASEMKPDLILLDILLPGETGISFLIKLRKVEDSISETPVVAFSNYDDQESKEEAFRLGAKDYLIKTANTPMEVLQKAVKYIE